METQKIIDGLQLLEKYRDKQNGFNTGADHDVIYAYATDKPLDGKDLSKMIELGWHQEHDGVDYNSDFCPAEYRVDESWHCYT